MISTKLGITPESPRQPTDTGCLLSKCRLGQSRKKLVWMELHFGGTDYFPRSNTLGNAFHLSSYISKLKLSRAPRRSRSTGAPGRKRLLLPRPSRTPRLVPQDCDVIAIPLHQPHCDLSACCLSSSQVTSIAPYPHSPD